MKKIGIGVLIAILFFTVGIFFVGKKNNQSTNQPVVRQPQTIEVPTPTIDAPPVTVSRQVTITVTSSGVDPKIITLYPGTIFIFANKSGANVTITAPAYPPLNFGTIKNNETASTVVDRPGVYRYKVNTYSGTLVVIKK